MILKATFLFLLSLIPVPGLTTAFIVKIGYYHGLTVFPYVFAASFLGAFVSFILARTAINIPQSWVNLTEASIEDSLSMLIALRVSPSPSVVLSYVIGSMKHISLHKYLVATLIGYQKLWIELIIGDNMNEVASSFNNRDFSQLLKSIVTAIGVIGIMIVIKKIHKNISTKQKMSKISSPPGKGELNT